MKTLTFTMGLSIFRILLILMLVALPTALILTAGVAHAENAGESIVATGLVWGDGINAQFTHNTWYAAGRHWVMYADGGGVWYSSTANYGGTWTTHPANDVTTTLLFRGLAVWYDEPTNIVHWARVERGNYTDGDTIYHWAATPLADGTLDYIDIETPVEGGGAGGVVGTIAIACDEGGYPFVAWTEDEYIDMEGNLTGYYWVEVGDSLTNDGTWDENDFWEEFDNSNMASYGHDYDTLYGAGNWTAVAVNLCPVGASGDIMQLSWSIEEMNGTHTAGIDSTILDDGTFWGNCSWVVPPDVDYGLYPDLWGELAFSSYDIGVAIHFVYTDYNQQVMYNVKAQGTDWEDISGYGNWTKIKDTDVLAMPAIAGYDAPGLGEDLIVVVRDLGGLYYDTKAYGPASFTGTWTTIWEIPGGPDGDFMFLHSLQYKYGADSPVGFAWDWGTLAWGNGTYTGELDYWWIDQDGEDAGENPLGWYYVAPSGSILNNYIALGPMVKLGPTLFLLGFTVAGIGLFIGGIGGMYNSARENKNLRSYIMWGIVIVISILMITIAYYAFPSLIEGAEQIRNL